jgi:glycerol-3-phosphate cytidylyltransferase
MKKGIVIGSFDVLHPGYIKMFNETRKHCDILVVALHKNPQKSLKPILSVEDRMQALYSLIAVAKIVVYETEEELYNILVAEKPDVRFVGDDYLQKDFTGSDLKIPVVYIDRSHGWSTTTFKRLIYESFK